MIMIMCVDDRGGLMFNQQCQSKDREVRRHILKQCRNRRLWMNSYSYKQFTEEPLDMIQVDEDFMVKAKEDEFCFYENTNPGAFLEEINGVILYKWNRCYPADAYLDIKLDDWKLCKKEDFTGNSHEKITMEVYLK